MDSLNKKPSQETIEAWHKDPANWKLGIFYFNREDKRLFPPKRIAMLGWTINFANPLSFLALAILVTSVYFITKLF
jgi:uncharacterized membrane protein